MIPSVAEALNTELEVVSYPSLQHQMLLDRNRIIGTCDDLEAIKQTVFKILNTERYAYVIYSWKYGVELIDLYGEPVTLVCPEVERRIKEALLMDDRIRSVDSFEFDVSKKKEVLVTFTVHTILGDIAEEMVVNY